MGDDMRGLIKTSAGLFIVAGGAVGAIGFLLAAIAFTRGATSSYASYPEMMGFIVALGGALSGASIVLVGGTAYLLASIDERIEAAIKKVTTPGEAA